MNIGTTTKIWAGIIATIPTGLMIWDEKMSLAIVLLFLAAALDTVTGVIKGFWCGKFKTSIAWKKGLRKFTRLIIAVIGSYILEVIGQSGTEPYSYIAGAFCCFLMGWAILEVVSVFENLNDMGLQTPKSFIRYVRRNLVKEECNTKKK